MIGGSAAVTETHSAIVFFVGEHAYKIKKPVDLGFLDFRSRATREAVCHREVELNRRLAPDVYLGVADVHDWTGELCDHLVVMRRMPAERRLSALVERGADVGGILHQVARAIAEFHGRSLRDSVAVAGAGVDATRSRWNTNTAALIDFARRGLLSGPVVGTVHGLAARYLDGREALFESRIAEGRVVDGHGDLQADDIFCLDDGPRILDCLEYRDDFRVGDGLDDVAFLAMDLERLGRPDLARTFLDCYSHRSGDTWPASLEHHYIAYRAQVRAKVSAVRALQGDHASIARARQLLDLAAHHLESGRVRLILVGGLPGSGKSTLAAGLRNELGARLLRSDEIRKERTGLPLNGDMASPYGEGIYTAAATDATYAEMLRRTESALELGETVVLDASWISSTWRARARAVARRTFSDIVELRCGAPPIVRTSRILARHAQGLDPSDATPTIAEAMSRQADEWPEASTIDTDMPIDATLRSALAALQPPAAQPPAAALRQSA